MTALLRSHEMRQEGYTEEHDGLCEYDAVCSEVETLILLADLLLYPLHSHLSNVTGVTIFSAPAYCGVGDNKGAFARIDAQGTMRFTRYEAVPPQGVKPMAYTKNLGGML